jgi:hypothetical protein
MAFYGGYDGIIQQDYDNERIGYGLQGYVVVVLSEESTFISLQVRNV